jgi:hypothetical protein
MRAVATCVVAAAALVGIGCTGTAVPSLDRGGLRDPTDSGMTRAEGSTAEDAVTPLGCRPDSGARLVCDPSRLDGVPWGPAVTLRRAIGRPPAPEGGAITPGAYQLVAETVYGNVEPNTNAADAGDRVQRVLAVDCNSMNERFRLDRSGTSDSGNDCRHLVPRELGVLEVSGWTGPGLKDSRDQVSYTARGNRLILIALNAYRDPSRHDLGVLGSFTYVSEFALVSGDGLDAAVVSEDAGASWPVGTGRDPRCPATPPASGDPCSPDPAPLECEYGGDAFHRCTTYAACVMDLSGAFHFSVDPASPCTLRSSPACPSSFGEASVLADQLGADGGLVDPGSPLNGLLCNYPEGVCACGPFTSSPGPCSWICRGAPSPAGGGPTTRCPMPRPLAGDPCTPGVECDYARGCGDPLSLGFSMICQSGYWENRGDMWAGCPPL